MDDRKGFTLVELIITVAIIAVLSATLAAAYVGYVRSSRETADEVTADTLVTSVENALNLPKFSKDAGKMIQSSGTGKVKITYSINENHMLVYSGVEVENALSESDRLLSAGKTDELMEKINEYLNANLIQTEIKSDEYLGKSYCCTVTENTDGRIRVEGTWTD